MARQQGRLAGAVASDKADATARIDRQIGTIQQTPAAHADNDVGHDQK